MSTPPPGWYDDPEDSKAQRYWDGQDWTPNRHPKPISQPPPPPGPPAQSAQPSPPPGLSPSPYQQAPSPLPGSGPPQKSRTPTVIAAVASVIAVLAVVGWLASPSTSSPPNTGNQGSPRTGNEGSPNTGNQNPPKTAHTPSWNDGYWFAYRNSQQFEYRKGFEDLHDFCAKKAKSQAAVQGYDTAEWVEGCVASFHKMGD